MPYSSERREIETKYNKFLRKIAKFCSKNVENVYAPAYLIKVLRLDANPTGIGTSLSRNYLELGFVKVLDRIDSHYVSFYGVSEICGPSSPTEGECFRSWCLNPSVCRTRKGNTKLKFHSGRKEK